MPRPKVLPVPHLRAALSPLLGALAFWCFWSHSLGTASAARPRSPLHPTRGNETRRAPSAGSGVKLSHVTRTRLYLDLERAGAIGPGARVELLRGERQAIGSCIVDSVSEHHASCPLGDLRVSPGDTPRVILSNTLAEPSPIEASAAGPTIDTAPVADFEAVPFQKVEYRGQPEEVLSRATLKLRERAAVYSGAGLTYARDQVSVVLQHLRLPLFGLEANADLRVLLQPVRPLEQRFRSESAAYLFVHEAMVTRRDPDHTLRLAIGRVAPWHIPGVLELDGGQIGIATPSDTLEVGAFAGFLPSLLSLSPTTERWAMGAYWSTRGELGPVRLEHEGRVNALRGSSSVRRGETEISVQASVPRAATTALGARFSFLDSASSAPKLTALRAEVIVSPFSTLELEGYFRERRDTSASDIDLDSVRPGFGRTKARHLGASGRLEVSAPLSVGAQFGLADDLDMRSRLFAGPEIQYQPLGSRALMITAGYQEEWGWVVGRMAYLGSLWSLTADAHTFLRLSYFADRAKEAPALAHQGLMSGGLFIRLWEWLEVRGSGLISVPLVPRSAVGGVGHLALEGRF